ncbi:MAG: hypothetical protein GEU82_01800 [Luteitalea sp.]|nr:hypothetical protein [Luteitalea sp.]
MKSRRLLLVGTTITMAVTLSTLAVVTSQAQTATAPSAKGNTFRTPWGEPDLQGIWSGDTLTPLQRPARFADKPVLTEAEAAKVEGEVHARPGRDDRSARGTEKDVAGAYNEHWLPPAQRLSDRRTGLIVDPADGKIPAMTPEATKRTREYREYLAALLQGTSGGRPGPISPRRNEPPPIYNTERMNRSDGPEDRATMERCFGATMPNYGAIYRIVQSPKQVAIYHDSGQGQGFVRVVPVDGSPHTSPKVRFLHGEGRGRWEGDTLVVDITNFSMESDFQGSRENLHLVERFTRTAENRIDYRVTVEDPTTWTRPWTFEVPWAKQPDRMNQVYESNCHEGNFGLLGMLANTRAAEQLFKEGKGPDPALQDNATGGGGGGIGREP